MAWLALVVAVAALVVIGRGLQCVIVGRRGRTDADPDERMLASLWVVAGVKMLNRGALLLVLALALLVVMG